MTDACCPACGSAHWPSHLIRRTLELPFSEPVSYDATVHRCRDCGEEVDRTPDYIVEATLIRAQKQSVRQMLRWLRARSALGGPWSFVAIERVLPLPFGTLDAWEQWAMADWAGDDGWQNPGPAGIALLCAIRSDATLLERASRGWRPAKKRCLGVPGGPACDNPVEEGEDWCKACGDIMDARVRGAWVDIAQQEAPSAAREDIEAGVEQILGPAGSKKEF